MKNKQLANIVFMVSAIAVLVAAAFHITYWFYAPYLFAIGAAGIAVVRLSDRYTGTNIRIKRLRRMEALSALLILASSFLMFRGRNEWFLLLFVAAILQLYAVIVMPKEDDNR